MDKASFQVIVLGPTGGPREDSVTGLLVRSTSTKWSSQSIAAVDAGTLLAGIIRALEQYEPETKNDKQLMNEGPFVGLNLPHHSAQANAAYIFQEIIGTILVTHPHLDHLAGLAINTPIIEAGSGPKAVGALPSVVAAIKNHLFNDVIWPNLSDEDGGAGLITYQRMAEGGNPRFGRGDARGYIRACEGLLTKCLSVSHGRCKKQFHPESGAHHRVGSAVFAADPLMVPSRAISVDQGDGFYSPARSPRLVAPSVKENAQAAVESSAFFIRDSYSGNEIIVFGDVEPDSISLDPRNARIWDIAAPKIASGSLRAIFIECSYDDTVEDSSLYGHLCPRHLIAELKILASKVTDARRPTSTTNKAGKRKRTASSPGLDTCVSPRTRRARSISLSRDRDSRSDAYLEHNQQPRRTHSRDQTTSDYFSELPDLVHDTPSYNGTPTGTGSGVSPMAVGEGVGVGVGVAGTQMDNDTPVIAPWPDLTPFPLSGLNVYIIHIKEEMSDGPRPRDRILEQLRARGEEARLGCGFYAPERGEGVWI